MEGLWLRLWFRLCLLWLPDGRQARGSRALLVAPGVRLWVLASREMNPGAPGGRLTHGTQTCCPWLSWRRGWGRGQGEGAGGGGRGSRWLARCPSPSSVPASRARARVSSSLPPSSGWGLEQLKSAMWPLALIPSLFPKGQRNPKPREGHRGQETGARPGPAADSAFWSETEDIGSEATTL